MHYHIKMELSMVFAGVAGIAALISFFSAFYFWYVKDRSVKIFSENNIPYGKGGFFISTKAIKREIGKRDYGEVSMALEKSLAYRKKGWQALGVALLLYLLAFIFIPGG